MTFGPGSLKVLIALVAAAGLAGCTGNGASREVLVQTLEEAGQVSQGQAQCVADAIYRGQVEIDGEVVRLSEDQINDQSSKSDGDRDPAYDALVEASLDECGVGA